VHLSMKAQSSLFLLGIKGINSYSVINAFMHLVDDNLVSSFGILHIHVIF
jgi:hypothetical protein